MSECTAVADELLACLQKVTFPGQPEGWQTVRTTLRTILCKGKRKELSEHLNTMRSQLALRMLALLNAKSDLHDSRQTETIDWIQHSNKEIVEVVAFESNCLNRHLEDYATRLENLVGDGAKAAQQRHQEAIAAILTLRDGNTQVLARPPHNGEASEERNGHIDDN